MMRPTCVRGVHSSDILTCPPILYNSNTPRIHLIPHPLPPPFFFMSTVVPFSLDHFLAVILIVAPLGAALVPIVGVLFFFTPCESRRRPVFILNVLACLLGICQTIFFASLHSSVILHPDKPLSRTTLLAAVAILLSPPILINSILLFRLLAFYPIQLTPRFTLIAVLTPTCICKAARLATLIAFIVTYPFSPPDAPAYATLPGFIWGRGPWVVSLVALQALDNSCVHSFNSSLLAPDQRSSDTCRQCSSISFIASVAQHIRYSAVQAVSTELSLSVPRRPHGAHVSEDIFSRVPAVFIIALGNYVVPYALVHRLCPWASLDIIVFLSGFPLTLRSLCS